MAGFWRPAALAIHSAIKMMLQKQMACRHMGAHSLTGFQSELQRPMVHGLEKKRRPFMLDDGIRSRHQFHHHSRRHYVKPLWSKREVDMLQHRSLGIGCTTTWEGTFTRRAEGRSSMNVRIRKINRVRNSPHKGLAANAAKLTGNRYQRVNKCH